MLQDNDEEPDDYESSIWLNDMIENNKLVLYKKMQNSNIMRFRQQYP